jgi:hypothetical protein
MTQASIQALVIEYLNSPQALYWLTEGLSFREERSRTSIKLPPLTGNSTSSFNNRISVERSEKKQKLSGKMSYITTVPVEECLLIKLPTEILLQIFESGPLLVGTDFEPPPLLLALVSVPSICKLVTIALEMVPRSACSSFP